MKTIGSFLTEDTNHAHPMAWLVLSRWFSQELLKRNPEFDVKFNDNVFFDPDGEKVRAIIRKMGFDLHEICMSDYLPDQITSLNGAPEAEPVVRDIFRRIMLWEFTVTERATMNPTPVNTSLPFKVVSEVKDGIFGNHTDSNGILIRSATDTSPYYVVGFRSEKGDHTYRYYGCTSAAPSP